MNQSNNARSGVSSNDETLLERFGFPIAFTSLAMAPLVIFGITRLVMDTLGLS